MIVQHAVRAPAAGSVFSVTKVLDGGTSWCAAFVATHVAGLVVGHQDQASRRTASGLCGEPQVSVEEVDEGLELRVVGSLGDIWPVEFTGPLLALWLWFAKQASDAFAVDGKHGSSEKAKIEMTGIRWRRFHFGGVRYREKSVIGYEKIIHTEEKGCWTSGKISYGGFSALKPIWTELRPPGKL